VSEINENVSIWARLYKRWEKAEPDLRSVSTSPAAEVRTQISAMEVELRALGARVDTAFNEASGALHNTPDAQTRGEQQTLR
jgi:hypothetical protein